MLPPPTTSTRRPASRAAACAVPAAVAGSSGSSLITRNCKVAAVALIPYADDDAHDPRVREVLERLPEPRINLFTMLANAPALIGPALRLGEAILTKGDLDVVLRELAILHTARITGTEYEWVQHEAIARLVGIEEEKIRAVAGGQVGGEPFSARESLALAIVGELAQGGTPSEDLVMRGESELGRAQLLELMIVAGYYAMLGGVMRAVRLDVDSVVEKGMLDRDRLGGDGVRSRRG
jgi:alkylhydroperoxidase family enzyme